MRAAAFFLLILLAGFASATDFFIDEGSLLAYSAGDLEWEYKMGGEALDLAVWGETVVASNDRGGVYIIEDGDLVESRRMDEPVERVTIEDLSVSLRVTATLAGGSNMSFDVPTRDILAKRGYRRLRAAQVANDRGDMDNAYFLANESLHLFRKAEEGRGEYMAQALLHRVPAPVRAYGPEPMAVAKTSTTAPAPTMTMGPQRRERGWFERFSDWLETFLEDLL